MCAVHGPRPLTERHFESMAVWSGPSCDRPQCCERTLMERCPWAKTQLYVEYHDHEWGVPIHDDRLLFEFLILEGAQAGLSWETILKKRVNYREAFDQFDAVIIA